MDKATLNKKLKALQKASSEQTILLDEIYQHCEEVYNTTPSNIDCDNFLDACTGAAGVCSGDYNADNLDSDMKECIKRYR